jgi:hypothetical protein
MQFYCRCVRAAGNEAFAVPAMLRPAPDCRKKPINKGFEQKMSRLSKIDLVGEPRRRRAAQVADAPIVLDESCSKPWGILRLLTLFDQRKGRFQGPRLFGVNLGVLDV